MLKYSLVAGLLTACISATQESGDKTISASQKTASNESAAPARDGNIAIIEEFEAAKAKNTSEAYALFIARHPNHPLTAKVKTLKAELEIPKTGSSE